MIAVVVATTPEVVPVVGKVRVMSVGVGVMNVNGSLVIPVGVMVLIGLIVVGTGSLIVGRGKPVSVGCVFVDEVVAVLVNWPKP